MTLAQRLASVHQVIERCGRNPDEVSIVAVTKGFGVEACIEARDAGLRMLGENRVHEALRKQEALTASGLAPDQMPVEWHLIGHLQTNKVRQAAGRFALIQSVDSVRLAVELAKGRPAQAALVEVNVAREEQKHGLDPSAALAGIVAIAGLIDVRGLMAMGPSQGDPGPAFEELRQLRDEAEQRLGRGLPVLSMGMSSDFEAALTAGSTMLRLGQVLFGPRPR